MSTLPSAVVFDMDGLLFDSESLYRDAILAAARDLGHKYTVDNFLDLVGRPWAVNRLALQEHIGPARDVEEFRAEWHQRYQAGKHLLKMKDGAAELLDRLDELRLPRAICTSSSHQEVHYNLALHALTGRFDAIVAAGDYARGKPAPDPFLRAAQVLGMVPEACLALEDSYNGVRAGAAAKMRTIMVPDLLPATHEMRSLCHMVVSSLHDVRALFG